MTESRTDTQIDQEKGIFGTESALAWNIGAAVSKLRTAHGLTQAELAHRARIDPSYVSHLEAGTKDNISMARLQRIAHALDEPFIAVLLEAVHLGWAWNLFQRMVAEHQQPQDAAATRTVTVDVPLPDDIVLIQLLSPSNRQRVSEYITQLLRAQAQATTRR